MHWLWRSEIHVPVVLNGLPSNMHRRHRPGPVQPFACVNVCVCACALYIIIVEPRHTRRSALWLCAWPVRSFANLRMQIRLPINDIKVQPDAGAARTQASNASPGTHSDAADTPPICRCDAMIYLHKSSDMCPACVHSAAREQHDICMVYYSIYIPCHCQRERERAHINGKMYDPQWATQPPAC